MPPDTMAPMPGMAPGAAGGAPDQQKEIMNKLVQSLMQRMAAPQAQGMQKPSSTNTPDSMQQGDYNMNVGQNKQQDAGIAMQNMGTFIHNMVAQHKQRQTQDAMVEWQGFDHALTKAQALAGDPSAPDYQQKVQQLLGQDPWVKSNLDPANPKAVKRLKNMYKALNVDLLSGDKENVHREGLGKMFKVKQALSKVMGAKQKMDQHKQQQQQQPSPEQRTQQFQQSPSKLMAQQTLTAPDTKTQIEAVKATTEALKAENSGLDRWQFKQGVGQDGKPTWFAFDPKQPDKVKQLTDEDGKHIGVANKGSTAMVGRPVLVEGKPMGVMGMDSKTGSPRAKNLGDPDWNESDARAFDAANKAYAEAEANKLTNTKVRAATYVSSRQYAAIDESGKLVYVNSGELNRNQGKYSPVSGGIAAMQKESLFADVRWNSSNVRQAAHALKGGFDATTRAQFIAALRSTDPTNAVNTWLSSAAAKTFANDEAKVNYVTSVASLMENAMAMRSLTSAGAGSEDLRNAILRTIPGAGSSSLKMVDRQLDLFDGSLDRLHTGVPKTVNMAPVSNPNDIPSPD